MKQLIIQLIQLEKKYKDQFALRNVDLEIYKGDIFGIIGLSGAGKSTLIKSLTKLIHLDSGKVLFHGQDIMQMEKKGLLDFRKKIGMVFQHFNLFSSRTVAKNIAYQMEIANVSKEEQEIKIAQLLDMIGLREKKDLYPNQLSGGEKQRVGIARALANDPEILLCDEATSSLDPNTTRDILALLKKLSDTLGVTIVLITHEMEVIKLICNQIAILNKGEIVEKGSVEDIFSDPKHPVTKKLLQNALHEIPEELLKKISPNRKILRLHFKGETAARPIISQMIRGCDVEANILLGWIDRVQHLIIGTLMIELTGKHENIQKALEYLMEHRVIFEVL